MIQAKNLTKKYGKHIAVNNLNFHIKKGEIIGFLGPNGAGKSTTMNIITGYLSASEGSVLVDGMDILENPEEVKRGIGYLPEKPPLYLDMLVEEYLNFTAEIKKVSKNDLKQDLEKIYDLVKIADVRRRLIKNLSRGYQQRVGLAQSLIGNPKLLILDEPTVGLDPKQIIEIRNLIKELRSDHTIVLSSHILPEVSASCSRVIIIDNGRIAASDTPDNLAKRLIGTNRIAIRIAGNKRNIIQSLKAIVNIEEVKENKPLEDGAVDLLIEAKKECDVRKDIFDVLSKNKFPILMMRTMDMTLEDIFLHIVKTEKGVTE